MRFEDVVFVYHLSDPGQIAWHGRYHCHGANLYEIHYFVSGEGSFLNASARYSIQRGSLYFSAPGMTHQILATVPEKPITYYAILIDASSDEETATLLDRLVGRGEGRIVGTGYRFFFADILEKHLSKETELEFSARHALASLLYQIAAGKGPNMAATDNAHIEKAIAIMQTRIERHLDLGELCEFLDVSREHFVRLFSSFMGMPPMRYYARLKIEAARAMLSSTNLHVGEIADKLGFDSQFSFSRAFRRATGISPTDYRDRFLQKVDFVVDKGGEDAEQAGGPRVLLRGQREGQ
ncbi:MAG TPA: AraC family transcriptional regulator [Rectinemataceae bacterium]|nr:AraC family transcriptional regulator [Rectinemataceae bacterium]